MKRLMNSTIITRQVVTLKNPIYDKTGSMYAVCAVVN